MQKFVWMLSLVVAANSSFAQHSVKFILAEKTCIAHDSIFITGTFSNWDSTSNQKYLLKRVGDRQFSITLSVPAGPLKYKFTRGTWLNVEKRYFGSEVVDRLIDVSNDMVLKDTILAWRDELLSDKWCWLEKATADTDKINVLVSIATNYAFFPENYRSDSALYYAQTALALQQGVMKSPAYKSWIKEGLAPQLIHIQELLATLLHSFGNYSKSLALRFENLNLAETQDDPFLKIDVMRGIGDDYTAMRDYENALHYGSLMLTSLADIARQEKDPGLRFTMEKWSANYLRASAYYYLDSIDAALSVAKKMFLGVPSSADPYPLARGALLMADIFAKKKGDQMTALQYYRLATTYAGRMAAYQMIAKADMGTAQVFKNIGRFDSSLYYARKSMVFFQTNTESVQAWGENSDTYIAEISPMLAALYKETNQLDSAYKYLDLSVEIKDRLYNETKIRQFQMLGFNEENRRKELANEKIAAAEDFKTNIKLIGLVASLLSIAVVAFILYRNNKQKQQANKVLEDALSNLQTTQAQLIQSEKMASLGELTAGIAHEIQNPLNFVNNFSEVNKELIGEMKAELFSGNTGAAVAIANDLEQNLEKINHHGKRADSIVKGMLQHSRASKGIKEPTDINKLADEYLRLAFHGLRAKDKSFNATIKTSFEPSEIKINVIPQDIGRALLNIFNNAFFAVDEKKKSGIENYNPTLSFSTKKIGDTVELRIADNGNGIPTQLLDKIFQPFFTTKPTGQGTGLGLSLAYDIIKAHGGDIKVESKDREGSEFIIHLPFTSEA